jgi:1-aminocyclopropane-1-carboxylate deaminase
MYHHFHEGGYAKTSIELEDTMKQFYSETGIQTEHIYSGKMILAAYKLLQNNSFVAGDKIVLLHTGGILNIDHL